MEELCNPNPDQIEKWQYLDELARLKKVLN